jgi:hypothetical protein
VDLDQLCAIVTGKASKMRIVRFDAATGLALSRYLRVRKTRRHASSDMLWIGGYGSLTSDGIYQMGLMEDPLADITHDGKLPRSTPLKRTTRMDSNRGPQSHSAPSDSHCFPCMDFEGTP